MFKKKLDNILKPLQGLIDDLTEYMDQETVSIHENLGGLLRSCR